MCCPGDSHSAATSGSRLGVVVTTMSASVTASRTLATAVTGMPSASVSSRAAAWAGCGRRLQMTARSRGRTRVRASSCSRACTPAPTIPALLAPARARYFAATAPAAAVRTSVR